MSAASDSRDSSALSSSPIARTRLIPARIRSAISRRNPPRERWRTKQGAEKAGSALELSLRGPRWGKFVCLRSFFPVMREPSQYMLRSLMTGTGGATSCPKILNLLCRRFVFAPSSPATCVTETGFYFGDRFVPKSRVRGTRKGLERGSAGLRNNVPPDESRRIIGQGSLAKCS